MLPLNFRSFAVFVLFTVSTAGCVVLQPTGTGATGVESVPSPAAGPCQITITDSSFGGYCGNLEVVNNGTYAMQGWAVAFDLPDGASLVSSWNGDFKMTGNHVVVTSLEPNVAMPAKAQIQLGYCSSGAATNISVVPGVCLGADGNEAVSENTASLNTEMLDTFTALDANHWNVVASDTGYATSCAISPNNIAINGDGLQLAPCGAIQTNTPIRYGTVAAKLRAAAGNGVVTQLMSGQRLPPGLQALEMAVSGSEPNALVITVWNNDVPTSTTVALGFDATADWHMYAFTWTATSIVWAVDGRVVWNDTTDLPSANPQFISLSSWLATGTPSWAGTADAAGTTTASFKSVSFTPAP